MAGDHQHIHVTLVDGCPVVWRCVGGGPPGVLLHGGHGNRQRAEAGCGLLRLKGNAAVKDSEIRIA